MDEYKFKINTSKAIEIETHLNSTNLEFLNALSARTDIKSYSKKICDVATTYEIWGGKQLIGLCAVYFKKLDTSVFITNFSVIESFTKKSIGTTLFKSVIQEVASYSVSKVELEVQKENTRALKFYEKQGFYINNETAETFFLILKLK